MGEERPLAFASRIMTASERNYSITEKEFLAFVWAVKKFRFSIWRRPIRIVTDHHALCWLQSKKDLAVRLSRWAMQLIEYKYTIAHKDGRLHADADALSCYPLAEGSGNDVTDKESRDLEVNVVAQCDRSELQEGQLSEWAYVFKNHEQKKRNRELHYTEWTTVQDSVDGWRAGGSVVATLRAEDLAGRDTESLSRRLHGRTPRKDQDVRQEREQIHRSLAPVAWALRGDPTDYTAELRSAATRREEIEVGARRRVVHGWCTSNG
jgi:hypothetical protein